MSDALTDIARDQRRSERYREYLEQLVKYLKNPSDQNYKKLEESAQITDSVPRGLWQGQSELEKGLLERAKKLKEGDKREWARTLWDLEEESTIYRKLKEISPFNRKFLIKVDYGDGFVAIGGELQSKIEDSIYERDYQTRDCDDYLLVLDGLDEILAKSEVIWTRCGIMNQNVPRNSNGEPRLKEY